MSTSTSSTQRAARSAPQPYREDLAGVAGELAKSAGALHAALLLDPARFQPAAVGSPHLGAETLRALEAASSGRRDTQRVEVFAELPASPTHAAASRELARLGVGAVVRVPLLGPGGSIGVADLLFAQAPDLAEEAERELLLFAEHAAMNVVNLRLFQLVERAKKEWEGTFDAIRDGISIHDLDCRIRRANWGLGSMLGTTPSRLVGQPCHEAIFGRDAPCRTCPLVPHGSAPSFVPGEHEDVIGDRTVIVSMYPLLSEEGTLTGVVHIVRDVTERKTEERDFRHMHDELVQAHATLTRSLEQLKAAQAQLVQSEKMAAVGQLISGVAHELNNPLTGILGYAQLLGGEDSIAAMPAEKLARYIHSMGKEASRCQRIVQNLLTFARRNGPEKQPTDVNDVVRRTVDLKAYELKVSDIAVDLQLAPDVPATQADAHQLQQVVLNLLHNASQAIKGGRGKGTITLRTRCDARGAAPRGIARWIVIEVEDDGPGFTDDVKRRMFDPFFTTKEVGQGTGLGLSICYGIVKEHDGDIAAHLGPSGGALMRVELPVVETRTEARRLPAPPAPVRAPAPGRRVLVIDDESTICDMVRDVLVLDGYLVETARNGEAGLRALESSAPDCILVDLKMPGIDGPTLYERLRLRDPRVAARMIFMTGDMLSESSRQFLERTGNTYLAKPFAIQDLRRAVAALVA
jgi:two-component system NtrC family sensor kinase